MTGQVPGLVVRRTLEEIEAKGEQYKYPELWDGQGQRYPHAKQILYGPEIDGLGTFFAVRLEARLTGGGMISTTGEQLVIREADDVVLLLVAASSFNGFAKNPSREGRNPSAQTQAEFCLKSEWRRPT